MSVLKLFRTSSGTATEIGSASVELERSLQTLIEANLEVLLGVRFLASEYVTGKTHGGRIDTLGIDENSCPVILEYKRALNENVINQGLYYLDWLLDHKAEIKLLVLDRFDRKEADKINWNDPRLICIASDFTRYDEHAVQQINRNIELIRYLRFGSELLLLEGVNAVVAKTPDAPTVKQGDNGSAEKTWDQLIAEMKAPLPDVYGSVRAYIVALGDDVQEKRLSLYIAFKRLKNFVCVELRKEKIVLYLKLNPDAITLEQGFSRDVRMIGHWGTGDLEISIRNDADFLKAQPLLVRSYGDS